MELEKLIYFGTKAPSGHNSQPWKFKVSDNTIKIYPDFKYSLPIVDPNHRELYISLGCAGENIRAAARNYGLTAHWSSQKDSEEVYHINISFKEEISENKDILELIENRQSNRNLFNGQPIPNEVIEVLDKLETEDNINSYLFKKGTDEFQTIAEFIKKGNEIQMNDPNFKNELLSWIRFNKKHIEKTKDGLTYKVMGSPSMPKSIGRLVVQSFFTPEKQNKSDEEKINSSSHFVLLTAKKNNPIEWISLGFSLERLLLKLTELGIANAYLNPPCEIPALAGTLRKQLPINQEYPAIIMRLGYADTTPYSPRRDVSKVIYETNEPVIEMEKTII